MAACAAAVGLTLLVFGAIVSCQRPIERAAPLPPPVVRPGGAPAGEVVRVRLADAVDVLRVATTSSYRVMSGSTLVASGQLPMAMREFRWAGSQWLVNGTPVAGTRLEISTTGDGLVICEARRYRGNLVLQPVDAQRFSVDNHVGLEGYLAGVLARELPRGWEEEAYKAQAVAARTYVLYEMRHDGRSRSFDVYGDQRSQVYGGVVDETAKSVAAVRATAAQVLVVGPPGQEHIFKAYYSSTCGGISNPADGLESQDEQVSPLSGGVVCTDCSGAGRYRWPTVQLTKAAVYQALATAYPKMAALGSVEKLRPELPGTSWGRVEWYHVVAADGRYERLRADDFRLAMLRYGPPAAKGLFSMNCTIRDLGPILSFEQGRGFGHSVGLCQYGTQGKALRGMKYYEILYAYYPGARIMKLNP